MTPADFDAWRPALAEWLRQDRCPVSAEHIERGGKPDPYDLRILERIKAIVEKAPNAR